VLLRSTFSISKLTLLRVNSDVQTTLQQTRPLFSSYLRIRTLATSPTSPELVQSRTELLSTLSTLSSDLSDLVDSVNAVESDPYRFGLDVAEVARRRGFVRDVGGEVESMRRELEGVVEDSTVSASAAAVGMMKILTGSSSTSSRWR
jgi:member of the syntaxin family of t-SNAREs